MTQLEWQWVIIFILMIALDYIWAKYNQATTTRLPWRASFYAIVIYALGAVGVIGYSENHWLLIPACAGAFVGTFVAVRFS